MRAGLQDLCFDEATLADVEALAALHVAVWRQTYADLAPAAALTALDANRRIPQWRALLGNIAPDTGAIVARREEKIVGVAAFGPPGSPAFGDAHEIKHLYVAASEQGQGIGRQLLADALDHLAALDVTQAALAVVKGNHAAREFYRNLGGVDVGSYLDPGPLWRSQNLIVKWQLPRRPRACLVHSVAIDTL